MPAVSGWEVGRRGSYCLGGTRFQLCKAKCHGCTVARMCLTTPKHTLRRFLSCEFHLKQTQFMVFFQYEPSEPLNASSTGGLETGDASAHLLHDWFLTDVSRDLCASELSVRMRYRRRSCQPASAASLASWTNGKI